MDEQREQMILKDIQNGMTRDEVAKKYHHSTTTVRKMLERYGISQKQGRKALIPKEQRKECNKLYREGATLKELAEKYKVSAATMRVALGLTKKGRWCTKWIGKGMGRHKKAVEKLPKSRGAPERRMGRGDI